LQQISHIGYTKNELSEQILTSLLCFQRQ